MWQEPDARGRPVPRRVPMARRVPYLIAAGGITSDPTHLPARVFGGALITTSGASGTFDETTGDRLFPGSTVRLVPKVPLLALAHVRVDGGERPPAAVTTGGRRRPVDRGSRFGSPHVMVSEPWQTGRVVACDRLHEWQRRHSTCH